MLPVKFSIMFMFLFSILIRSCWALFDDSLPDRDVANITICGGHFPCVKRKFGENEKQNSIGIVDFFGLKTKNMKNVEVPRRTSLQELDTFLGDLDLKIGDIVRTGPELTKSFEALAILDPLVVGSSVELSNIRFRKNGIDDIYDKADLVIDTSDAAEEKFIYKIEVVGLETIISGGYDAKLFDSGLLQFLTLSGSFTLELGYVGVDITMRLLSDDFELYPPSRAKQEFCEADISISNVYIDGFLLENFQGLIPIFNGLLESILEGILCNQSQQTIDNILSYSLGNVTNVLKEYIVKKDSSDDDFPVLSPQLIYPNNIEVGIVDFSNTSHAAGNAISLIVKYIDMYFSGYVEDRDSGLKDLGINVLLRSLVLDEETGELSIQTDFPLLNDNFVGVNTSVVLKEMQIRGLDKFSLFTPLRVLSQTLAGEFALEYLMMKLKFEVKTWSELEMESSAGFAINLGSVHSEEFTLELSFEDLYSNISGTFLLDREKLDNIPVGSFFNVSNILPCAFASLNFFEIKELLPSVKINAPNVQDLFDPRVGEMVTNLFWAIIEMSSGAFSNAFPTFVSTTGRETLNTVAQDLLANVAAVECPLFTSSEEALLDYRDFLLYPEDAISKGGTGTSPYGDIFAFVKGAIEDNFVSEDDDGNPKLNSILASITEGNSGEVGLFQFSPSFRCNQDILGALIGFEVKDFSVRNMDNVLYPFEIFQPTGPYVARSRMTVGTPSRPLKIDMEFAFLSTKNGVVSEDHFKVALGFPRIAAVVSILSMVKEEDFMQFPLINLPIINCWLALFQTMGDRTPGIQLQELDFQIEIDEFSFECVTCSRLSSLRDLLGVLKNPKVFSIVLRMLLYAGTQYLKLDFLEQFNDMIVDSSRSCPSHVNYNPAFSNETIVVLDALAGNLTVALNQNENVEVDQQLCLGGGSNINIPLPKGPYERPFIESLIFSGIFVGVMSKGLAPIFFSYIDSVDSWEPSDPLLTQTNLTQELEDKFMDISDLNSTFLSFVVGPMEMANASVSGMVDDPINGGTDIGANVMIKRFLNGQSVLRIPLSFNLLDIFVVESLEISGLDTFTMLNAVDFIGPQTFRSRFELSFIKVKINGSVIFLEGANGNNTLNETMSVSMGFHNIKFDVAVFLGIVEESFKNIRVGSLLFINQIMSCFLSVFEKVSVTRLISSIARFDELYIEGFFADDLRSILMSLDKDITSMFGKDLVKTMPGLLDGVLRPFLNNFIAGYLHDIKCMFSPPGGQFIDLRDLLLVPEMSKEKGGSGEMPYGNLISTLYGIASNNFFDEGENGFVKINNQIRSFTQEGTVEFPNPVLDISRDLSKVFSFRSRGTLKLKALYDTKISGLDSILHPLVVFYPEDAHTTENLMQTGTISKPLILATRFYVELDSKGKLTYFDVKVKVKLTGAGIQSTLKAYLSENFLMNFPFANVANFNCWLALFPPIALNEFGINDGNGVSSLFVKDSNVFMDNLILEIECVDCEDDEFRTTVNNFASEDLRLMVEGLVTSDYLQMQIDRGIFNAMRKCPHHNENATTDDPLLFSKFNVPYTGGKIALAKIFKAVFIGLAIFVLVVKFVRIVVTRAVGRRHTRWLLSLDDAEILSLYREQRNEDKQQEYINEVTTAMLRNVEIPFLMRCFIPVVVVLNCGLFIVGHINLSGTIDSTIKFANQPLTFTGMFEFSIINLIYDMWRLASKVLSVVVAITSAVWPYVKQITTLILWVAPPRYISCETRGWLYRTLDILGKWSMIDVFLIVMAMSIFRLSAVNPPNYPPNYFSLDMMMIPLWGLFLNGAAQVLSQISSHWIIYYHDKIVRKAALNYNRRFSQDSFSVETQNDSVVKKVDSMPDYNTKFVEATVVSSCSLDPMIDQERKALCNHMFILKGSEKGFKGRMSVSGNIFVGAVCVFTFVFIIAGSLIRYIKTEFTGVISLVVDVGGLSSVKNHNVFSVAAVLLESGKFVESVGSHKGTRFITITLFFLVVLTCFFVPLAQLMVVTVAWFMPMKQNIRERLYTTLEVVKAWQYVEVYYLGLLIMMWQAEPISEKLVQKLCWQLEDFFNAAQYFELLPENDSTCLMLTATLEYGAIVHIIASILLWWVTKFVEAALKQQIFDSSLRSIQSITESIEDRKSIEINSDTTEVGKKELNRLRKTPLKFTDEFSWFLGAPLKSK